MENLTSDDILRILGGPDQIAKELEEFSRSATFWRSNCKQLLEQYPEQWIAIHDEQVKAVSPDFHKLLRLIEVRSLPRGNVLIRFMERNPPIRIFAWRL